MAFYSEIVDAYDAIFPYNEKQLLFVESKVGELAGQTIMDIGCGTGSLSIAMARRSARVRGFDFDSEMLAKAEAKRPQALDLQFRQGDMRLVSNYFTPANFDAVLCLGNTLVHLNSLDEVEKTISGIAERLKPGGRFILQIVNYDRIIADHVDCLPTIKTDNYSFVRNYHHTGKDKVDFETILKTPTATIKNSVPLLMITRDQIDKLLSKYFSAVNYFGGFDGSVWSLNSFHLVVEAIK